MREPAVCGESMTESKRRRAVFLDRDGVLNEVRLRDGIPLSPTRPQEAVVLAGVADACRRLANAGWLLIVVTNQPDIARGTSTREQVEAINAAVTAGLPVSEIVVCPHDDVDRCTCRKPLPGMLLDAAKRWDLDLAASWMIGDRWRDIDAGRRAGVRTIFIDRGYSEELRSAPDRVASDLAAATKMVLDGVDDWENHWLEFADSASDNPAQAYRRELIAGSIERGPRPARILDVGCGQGDLLAALHARWPDAELVGIDLSAEGIRQTSNKVPGARLLQIDLLRDDPFPSSITAWADVAVCSEVLEHLEDPGAFLRAAAELVAPGGRLIVTVPGGPRTAFDRHIGHRRHFRVASLMSLLRGADLDVVRVLGAGFPFFNLYKIAVLLRGKTLIRDVSKRGAPSGMARTAMRLFGWLLRPSRNASRCGWQLIAVAHRRSPRDAAGPHAATSPRRAPRSSRPPNRDANCDKRAVRSASPTEADA